MRRASNTAVDYTPKRASTGFEGGSGEKPPRSSMIERLGLGLNSKVNQRSESSNMLTRLGQGLAQKVRN